MNQSEKLGELAGALAKAQATFEAVKRDKTVKVETRTGGSYSFTYADLESIWSAIRKPLAENGLCVTQSLEPVDGKTYLATTLMHASGEWIKSLYEVGAPSSDPQRFGSALTYGRRYSLTALVGIVSDEDDDGNHASGNTVKPRDAKASPTTPTREQEQAAATLDHERAGKMMAKITELGFTPAEAYQLATTALKRKITDFTQIAVSEAGKVWSAAQQGGTDPK